MSVRLLALMCLTLISDGVSGAAGWDQVVDALLAKLDAFDVLALGEWHGSLQDSELRMRLIRHPEFPRKVRYVVIEFGNAHHQAILDRFIHGGDVRPEEIRCVWRDITSPGGADSPVYESFLTEIRRINRALPEHLRTRVLAADPPVDWSTITSREHWRTIAGKRDNFAAELIEREVISKGGKALVICGSAHLWQKNQVIREPNLANLLKQQYATLSTQLYGREQKIPGQIRHQSTAPRLIQNTRQRSSAAEICFNLAE